MKAKRAFALLGCLALCLASCDRQPSQTAAPKAVLAPPRLAVPDQGAYTGAYIDFGDQEDAVTLEGLEEFEGMVGKHQAIVAFSSYWGEQNFPAAAAQIVTAHGSVPLIFWSPWDRPYSEEAIMAHGSDRFNLGSILAGQWDRYIDEWADAAKAVSKPIMVSLCNEMNGNWFPWSGYYYGGNRPIAGSVPQRYVGPEYFKRAYRYIVDRVPRPGCGQHLVGVPRQQLRRSLRPLQRDGTLLSRPGLRGLARAERLRPAFSRRPLGRVPTTW